MLVIRICDWFCILNVIEREIDSNVTKNHMLQHDTFMHFSQQPLGDIPIRTHLRHRMRVCKNAVWVAFGRASWRVKIRDVHTEMECSCECCMKMWCMSDTGTLFGAGGKGFHGGGRGEGRVWGRNGEDLRMRVFRSVVYMLWLKTETDWGDFVTLSKITTTL